MIRKTDRQILQRLWTDWVLIYRGRLGMIFLLMVVVAAAGGLYPALISHVFDLLAGTSDAHRDRFAFLSLPDDPFIAIPALIILVASIKAAAMYFQVLGVNSLALRITTDIQKAMSAHLIGADLAVVSAQPAGAFISRIMNDLNLVREALVRLANNLVRDILTILVMVTVMVWFSWLLSLLVLAVYPLAMRPIIGIGRRQRAASGALQEHLEEVTSLLAETLQGIRMVKAYQREGAEKSRSASAFDILYDKLVHLLAGRARIDPILEVLGGFAIAGVIGVAAWQVQTGAMQVGDVVGFLT
ncbi:MAG: ABC transporter transmembrane domain-containing protein, partial [Alphaproteobacteria bacterium]|nr:ABC transporter transmembrane domain-containing protein [Alphaproteobacteria bacterium]